ncbi:MAG: SnoaL-like domain-containing protein [Chryseolinea sp.]
MKTKEKVLTTLEVADLYYELSEKGEFDRILTDLYDQNIRSVEPEHSNWQSVQGIGKVKEKAEQWHSMIEVMHGGYTNKPQVAGNFFTCVMGMDATLKDKQRLKMDEVAVFEVQNGRIVLEQFFF